ncbi:PQQ-dependent sugar dehydrogenase [Umezawaea sp. Da 62-37]|uniref:PQQ-dependent sugar dehydrogenase n=1 Tax=Umezawaea sp. Da 62-37 TaxID=3075927 RepID=UPI0028F6FAD7|nr:PQQ-dependent sugar dehydrogenase [Umezawaea sp. Da 62-37]WNV82274.1 PQQ-dependent sugar dehydrogenase [Umezawaea sp. Da 62-37]
MNRLVGVLAVALVAGCSTTTTGSGAPPPPSQAQAPTGLKVEEVVGGLSHAWDVGFLPGGQMLVTQRDGKLTLVKDGKATDVKADLADVEPRGEGGLMGLVVHPDFLTSHRFTTCQTSRDDVRLVTWQLSDDGTSAQRIKNPLLGGLPVNPSGRHSGCRPTIAQDGSLLVGTGDTANGTAAQNLDSLGGKVLRISLETGAAQSDNPIAGSRVYTYGHRNVQGVAVNPKTGQVFTAEHGPDIDDELNLLKPGANYGWDPGQGGTKPGYDEGVPMTDLQRFPDAVPAVWVSGDPTEAISGAAFLASSQWGDLEGVLAVAALKGSKLMLFTLTPEGGVHSVAVPAELDGTHGRLRAARLGPDGALYVTSSNGTDDKLLKVTRG